MYYMQRHADSIRTCCLAHGTTDYFTIAVWDYKKTLQAHFCICTFISIFKWLYTNEPQFMTMLASHQKIARVIKIKQNSSSTTAKTENSNMDRNQPKIHRWDWKQAEVVWLKVPSCHHHVLKIVDVSIIKTATDL